jgi:hypothetical protein
VSRLFGMIGAGDEQAQPSDAEVRAMRVQQARTRARWTEIPESQLVRRERWYVDAETDRIYSVYLGDVFTKDGIVAFDEQRELAYFVRSAGALVRLEQSTLAPTWSDFVYQRERARAGAR